jgi:hypothetical protein
VVLSLTESLVGGGGAGTGGGGLGMLRHEFCVLVGECVLSLGISRGENIVPDNLEIVSARKQDNDFCYITVDPETHMLQNRFGFYEPACPL